MTTPSRVDTPGNAQRAAVERAIDAISGKKTRARRAQAIDALGSPISDKDEFLERFSSDLGRDLARTKQWGFIELLADRGWSALLYPKVFWRDPFDPFAAEGPSGIALLEKLWAGGVRFFGPESNGEGASPLVSAARRGDAEALAYFLCKMEAEGLSSKRARAERGRLAHACLGHPVGHALILPLIKSDPGAWAPASDAQNHGALDTAIHRGMLDLADKMIQAHPASALEIGMSSAVFSSKPLEAIKMLSAHGVDPKKPDKHGLKGTTPLHYACALPRHSVKAAQALIKMGADPRARDDQGATPIGSAMAYWSWTRLRRVLGAKPSDLLDSMSRSMSRSNGFITIPSLIASLEQARFITKNLYKADARMAELIKAAADDPRARQEPVIRMGLEESAYAGLPECYKAFAALAMESGVFIGPESLLYAIESAPMGDPCEAGRKACLREAKALGVDMDRPYGVIGHRHDKTTTKTTTLLYEAVMAMIGHSTRGDASYFKPLADMARVLVELGAHPMALKNDKDGWSFDLMGLGRSGLPLIVRQEFEALGALREAIDLRNDIGHPATASARPAPRI